jgi:hydrogenase maturation protein HypF
VNSDTARVRKAVRVTGTVQGVGFRPFVYSLAARLGLSGFVGNDAGGVFAEVEGDPAAVGEFLVAVERDAPPLARIQRVVWKNIQANDSAGFTIAPSEPGARRTALIAADSATCADCLAELGDPADRRYRYPFINCTNCGPRFTIVTDVPYDRPNTTMAGFAMCERCAAEYHDPADRRFHAQPVCCPACGPRLSLRSADGSTLAAGDPLAAAAALLRDGRVLAVKGLGGYHLAVDALSQAAAAALRARKHREDKPFAVMAASLDAARQLCEVDEPAAGLLTGPRRPIVLMPRRPGTVAGAVAPGNRQLGVMLPYTPLHHLLLDAVAGPVVLTSGNVSDEPIAYRDEDAFTALRGIADAFLTHDRAIHIRTDDSVVRVWGGVAGSGLAGRGVAGSEPAWGGVAGSEPAWGGVAGSEPAERGRETIIRRSRGYVPEPVTVRRRFPRPVLACGAELKNTFCLAAGDRAFVSHHIGDLENAATLRSFTEGIAHFGRLFGIEPQVVAYDLHPEYLSTKYALDLDLESCGVQHHHAHIAACLADNGHDGPVIGVAFDGTGYGTDGTLWGGEFLVADLAGFQRAGHLAPVPMPGGTAAIRQPWRMAASYLRAAFPDGPPSGLDVVKRNERNWAAVTSLASQGVHAPLSSSAGRLFDAVAALLSVRDTINYEGQAAVELEQLADPGETGSYRAEVTGQGPFCIEGAGLVRAVTGELTEGVPAPLIAARFHNGVAALIEDGCVLARERHGLDTVALSGGVFQNVIVAERAAARLAARGFRVLTHSRVPCNDGGISLGQAVVAGARDRALGN